jgi:hypothetical protein
VPPIPIVGDPPIDPNNPPSQNFAIIAPDIIVLCDGNRDCSGIKVQTMRTYLYLGE